MSRELAGCFLLSLLAFPVCLCGQTNTGQNAVTGTVAYRQQVELPLDAAIAVRLEDVSIPDPHAKVLSESIISATGHEAPITFQLVYDPTEIVPSHIYQVNVTVTANGTLLFTSSTPYRVLTHGAPSKVSIILNETSAAASLPHTGTQTAAPPSAITLQDTKWKLYLLGGEPPVTFAGGPELQIVLHKEQNRVTGSSGCKEILGTYTATQSSLVFTLTNTLAMACPPDVIQQEQLILNAIKATRGYRIIGNQLDLLLGDEVLAAFRTEEK